MADVKKVSLSKDAKEKLKGYLPLVGNKEWKFVPASFKDLEKDEVTAEFVPTFTVKPWNNKQCGLVREQFAEAMKKTSKKQTKKKDSKEELLEFVADQLIDWTNFIDISTEKEIAFDEDLVPMLSDVLLNDVFNELLAISGIINRKYL